jgi:hypothetical protein
MSHKNLGDVIAARVFNYSLGYAARVAHKNLEFCSHRWLSSACTCLRRRSGFGLESSDVRIF